jgi:hypothetical protein
VLVLVYPVFLDPLPELLQEQVKLETFSVDTP